MVDDADDGDVLIQADNERLVDEVGYLQAQEVEAQVRNGWRVGEPQGDTDGFTRARGGLSECPVLLVTDIRNFVKDDPGRRARAPPGEGGIGG